LAATLYQNIGTEIQRRDHQVMSGRVRIPTWRVAWLAWLPATRWLFLSLADRCFGRARASFPRQHSVWSVYSGESIMNQAAKYLASLGLSLTLIMATALFAMVGINPKDASYGNLPWLYAAVSAVAAAALGYVAHRLEPSVEMATAPVDEQ
jgi:hypothetical protein